MSNLFDIPTVSPQQEVEEEEEVQQEQVQKPQTQGNLFDTPTPKPEQKSQAPESTGNTFLDGVMALGMSVKRTMGGVEQKALAMKAQLPKLNLGEFAGKPIEQRQAELAQEQRTNEQGLAAAKERSPWAAGIGELVGDIGTGVVVGGAAGAGKSLLGKMGATAVASATQSGMEYASSDKERFTKAATSGAMGATVSGILAGIPKLGRLTKKIVSSTLPVEEGADNSITAYLKRAKTPKAQAVEDLAYNVKTEIGAENVSTKMASVVKEAAESKIKKTPGQTFGGDILPAKETSRAVGDANKRAIQAKKVTQQTEALKELDNTLDSMVPGKPKAIEEAKKAAYKTMDETPIDEGIVKSLKKDANIKEILDGINTNDKDAFSKLDDTNFRKLYAIKQDIDSQLKLDKSATAQDKLKPGIKAGLKESRDKFRKAMKPYPEYEKALRYHEQLSTRQKYMDLLDTKATKEGQKMQRSAQESYDVLFSTPKKQKAFLADVAKSGGNVEQSKAIIETLDDLRQNILPKTLRKQPSEVAKTGVGGRMRGVVQEWISKATLDDYHEAVLKLNMGDTWQKDVAKVLKNPKSGDSRGFKLLELLMEVSGKIGKTANTKPARIIGSGIKTGTTVNTNRRGYLNK